MLRHINVSAPSKVILHGEHAVVYGKSAIAASLDLRTKMCLVPLQENILEVDFPDVGVKKIWKSKEIKEGILHRRPNKLQDLDPEFLQIIEEFLEKQETTSKTNEFQKASLTCFFYLYSLLCEKFVPLQIKVESEIPLGAGLGSSAALSVCLAAGLYATKYPKIEDSMLDEICKYAFISEKILHGQPSGIDNTVSTYGGFIHFKNSKIEPIECSDSDLKVLLVNTNVPRSTKSMVQAVNKMYQNYPEVVGPTLDAINGVSEKSLEILRSNDTKNEHEIISYLVDYNQKLLEALGVSHPALEDVIKISKEFGLSAKLTGAGGGGFALIVLPPSIHEKTIIEINERLVKKNFKCYQTCLGVEGVRVNIENSDVVCISQ